MSAEEPHRSAIDRDNLPDLYPTHAHPAEFWEALGRAVGTFGFLEEILGRAIFSFTATKEIAEEDREREYVLWLPKLERALSDPLGSLINSYRKAVQDNKSATIANLDELISDLRAVSELRNVICHGSWRKPNEDGLSVPLFVTRDMRIFQTGIDAEYLVELREFVLSLICTVMDTVTHMGWQFPGSRGPGSVIFAPRQR